MLRLLGWLCGWQGEASVVTPRDDPALYGRCYDCAAAFGSTRADETEVRDSSRGDGQCSRCAVSCECCDSEEAHDAAVERSRLDFLRSPGAMPEHWDAETMERVERSIAKARAEAGIK